MNGMTRDLVRKYILVVFLFITTTMAFGAETGTTDYGSPPEEGTVDDIAAKAKRAHDMAASDVIYQQEDFRALYYQNQQIIALLGDVRDNLQNLQKQQASKTEDKS